MAIHKVKGDYRLDLELYRPLTNYGLLGSGSRPKVSQMKLDDIKIHKVIDKGRERLYLEARYEGESGWGEIHVGRPSWDMDEITSALKTVGDYLTSIEWEKPPELIDNLWKRLMKYRLDWGKGAISRLLSGVDQAVYDLYGKVKDEPLYRVLGGEEAIDIPIYVAIEGAEVSRETLNRWMDIGVAEFKVILTGDLEKDIKIVHQVSDILDEPILVDADMAYTQEEALSLMKEAGEDIKWFEDPVYMDDIGSLDMVKRIAIMNFDEMVVAGGERIYDKFDMLRLFEKYRLIDVYITDITRNGGLKTAIDVGDIAAKNKVGFSPYVSGSIYSLYGSIHLALSRPDVRYIGVYGGSGGLDPGELVDLVNDGVIPAGEILNDVVGIGPYIGDLVS